MAGRRDDIVLATKFFMPMGDDPSRRGGSRRWIMRAVEDSLRRLGTDHIDLYQVHRPSPDTDVEETLGALTDLVRQGKVRYLGSSSYAASQIVEAQWAAREASSRLVACCSALDFPYWRWETCQGMTSRSMITMRMYISRPMMTRTTMAANMRAVSRRPFAVTRT